MFGVLDKVPPDAAQGEHAEWKVRGVWGRGGEVVTTGTEGKQYGAQEEEFVGFVIKLVSSMLLLLMKWKGQLVDLLAYSVWVDYKDVRAFL